MRALPLAACAVVLAGCPEQLGQQCPPQTIPVGQFTLTFVGQHPEGECTALQSDGGPPATPLTADAGGVHGATFCYGNNAQGGPLWLALPGKTPRPSPLLPDGGFHFVGHSDPVPSPACACNVGFDETFDGFLTPETQPFAIEPDGGFPAVTAVTGTLVDNLSTDAGSGCLCNLPCPMTFTVSGPRF
jgi:hypothetical protein